MSNYAIIPSGGIGSRFNSPIPKQYVKVLGKELLAYTLEVFQKCEIVDEIIVPADESYFNLIEEIKNKYSIYKLTKIVKGGKERQDSVYNGLLSKRFKADDLIIVHDAARPLLSLNLLNVAIEKAKKLDSVVVAIKSRDTLIENNNQRLTYLNRERIYYAQTPQIFRYQILYGAYKFAQQNNFRGTDESMLVANASYKINLVDGEFENFKITTKDDLLTFEKLKRIS